MSVLVYLIYFLLSCYCYHRDLHVLTHSFPTRRSSDLVDRADLRGRRRGTHRDRRGGQPRHPEPSTHRHVIPRASNWRRSEEHTSELQSLMRNSYAVFCLKKKKKNTNI